MTMLPAHCKLFSPLQAFFAVLVMSFMAIAVKEGLASDSVVGTPLKSIVVATELDYPPYSCRNEQGEPIGFNVDLTRALLRTMGRDGEVHILPWSEARAGLSDGSVQAIAGMYYSGDRAKHVEFTSPFLLVHHAIFARANTPPPDAVEDLRGKELIVMEGDIMHDYLLGHSLTDRVICVPTQADALRLLASGKHDYALVAHLPGVFWIRELGLDNLRVVGPSLNVTKYCFAVPKSDRGLAAKLSESLAILKQTGEYQEIYDKWLGVLEPRSVSLAAVFKYVAAAAIPLVLVLGVFAFWSRSLARQVQRRTAELQESEQRLEMAIETAQLGLWDWHIPQNHRIFNDKWAQMLGYLPEELSPGFDTWKSLMHPDDLGRTLESLQSHLDHDTEYSVDFRLKAKSGQWVWVHSTGRVVQRDAKGNPVRMIGIHQNVTDRKKTELELAVARDEADAANRAKSEFLANMSHEIRTPMTAIIGFADILLDSPSVAEAQDAAVTIRRNAEHLLTLINDILDLSKIEAGRVMLESVPCSPSKILDDVLALMKVKADAKGIPLRMAKAKGLPERVLTDPTRLRQILINLVGNAIKFTETGSVEVAVSLEEFSLHSVLRFEVTDTGIGLAPEQITSLFQPFAQADASTTRKFGGSGLGLVICRRLAKMLGGDISIESELGVGSTFGFYIQVGNVVPGQPSEDAHITEEIDARPSTSPQSVVLDGCRILLAEDGQDNQRLIAFLLRKAGANVDIAENGAVAVELAIAAQPFDLILMDMQMPLKDGYQATRELRAIGHRAPIVALTAHAMKYDEQKCLCAGCDAYLAKPIDRAKLLETVARFIQVGQGVSEA